MVNKDLHISSKHGRVKDNRRLTVLLLSETSLKRVIPFPGEVISWRGHFLEGSACTSACVFTERSRASNSKVNSCKTASSHNVRPSFCELLRKCLVSARVLCVIVVSNHHQSIDFRRSTLVTPFITGCHIPTCPGSGKCDT